MLNRNLGSLLICLLLSLGCSFPCFSQVAGDVLSAERVRVAGQNSFFTVERIPSEILSTMLGLSLPDNETGKSLCRELRLVRVLHVNFDNKPQVGWLICHESVADDLKQIFRELYDAGYQIEKIIPVDAWNADDEKSMEANNTSAFNYRRVKGTKSFSLHAFGRAIDVNPLYNPHVTSKGIHPASAKPYVDRKADFPHKLTRSDLCVRTFLSHGWTWGGDWRYSKDYQHFQKRH